MRIALGVEYDGSGYNGWQSQPDVPNVQDALQRALSEVAGESISVLTAGRTDTGVHALEQVIHFDTAIERPLTAWVRGVARLTSSAKTTWAKIGPGRNSNSCAFWLNQLRPVTSEGSRSGVN